MQKIRIITDSASDIVKPHAESLTVLPMTISFGGSQYKDGETITHREFYEKLIESDELPTTSLISPAVFEEAFKTASDAGEQVIVITLSSKLSGTYRSACIASEAFDNVSVIDSLSAAVGEQILVRYALSLINEGKSADEIANLLEDKKKNIHVVALLNTLEYLKKGGRISPTVAFVGGMLSVKPVAAIINGEVAMLGKARGSKNGNNFLVKEIENAGGIDFSMPLCLGYTGLDDSLLKKYIEDSEHIWHGHDDCLNISCIGATIGTHIGPGTIAIGFFSKMQFK